MPLNYNIANTEAYKSGLYKDIYPEFICMVGMEVLNIKVGGYNYSMEWFILDEKLANKIIKKLLITKETHWNEKEIKQINEWIPKLIGARFIRLH